MGIGSNKHNFYRMGDMSHCKINDNNNMDGIYLLLLICAYNGHCRIYLLFYVNFDIYVWVNNVMECVVKWVLFEVCYGF